MNVTREWLTYRVDDAPTSFASGLPDRDGLRVRMAWQKLQRLAREGDELWAFANPPATRRKLGTCTGFALVRDGEVVESVVTSRS